MSGTSGDGVDASIISSDGKYHYNEILNRYFEYDQKIYKNLHDLRAKILKLDDLIKNTDEIDILEREITIFHAKITNEILKTTDKKVDFIGFHGQTIYHNPNERISKQIGDGNLLSQLCKKDVIYNFRQVDIENGGEGAPLTPIFHNAIVNKNLNNEFDKFDSINILNIGGIANITKSARWDNFYKSTDMLQASDIGPGNCMIDSWIRNNSNSMFDNKGKIASHGKTDILILNQALENLNILPPYNKSLDINDFDISFVRGLNLENGASTLSDLTAAGDSFSFPLAGFDGFDTPSTFSKFNRAVKAVALVYSGNKTEALAALSSSFFNLNGDLSVGPKHVFSLSAGDVVNGLYKIVDNNGDQIIVHNSFIADAEPGDKRVENKTILRSDPTTQDGLNGTHQTKLYASNINLNPRDKLKAR